MVPRIRIWAVVALAAIGGCAHIEQIQPTRAADPAIDWTTAKAVAVKMTDFDFTPARFVFTTGQPVRLTLTNDGSGRHDFAAPAFFAASAFRQGGALPGKGKVSLAKDQSTEIDLVPQTPGQYPLDCTEFLHDMLGMTGEITVSAGH